MTDHDTAAPTPGDEIEMLRALCRGKAIVTRDEWGPAIEWSAKGVHVTLSFDREDGPSITAIAEGMVGAAGLDPAVYLAYCRDEIVALRARAEQAEQSLRAIREDEAACTPPGVSFRETIATLRQKWHEAEDRAEQAEARAEAERDALRARCDVLDGAACAEGRAAGRGGCGMCAWCCKQARAERDALRAERDRLAGYEIAQKAQVPHYERAQRLLSGCVGSLGKTYVEGLCDEVERLRELLDKADGAKGGG